MSKKQPTPDSWAFWAVNPINPTFVDGPPGLNCTEDGDWAICQTFGPDAEANAVLIAASRDMLAALEMASDELHHRASGNDGESRYECAGAGHCPKCTVNAAIAKAKGESC